MALTLLRHTRPVVKPGICYGHTDLALAPSFMSEAKNLLVRLPNVTHIASSPLIRCQELAAIVASQFHCEYAIDERLIEMDFGRWEGRLWSQIPRQEIDAWRDDFMHARPHGGESVAMVSDRTRQALQDWREKSEDALIVTHLGVIKAACATGHTAEDFSTHVGYGEFVSV